MPPVFKYLLSKNLEGKVLTDEKIRDFRNIVLAQVAMIVSLFLLELFTYLQFPNYLEISETIFFTALGVYVFLLWDTLRNYTTNKKIVRITFFIIMGIFLFGLVGVNPFFPMAPTPVYRVFLAFIQVCVLTVEVFVIYYTILEFFKKDLGLPIKLWGAAAMYVMIGFAFGSVYEILCTMQIDCLGVEVPLRAVALMTRIGYSLMVLSGMNTPFDHISGLLYSTSTIEALCGQIFIVLIVGRFLVK